MKLCPVKGLPTYSDRYDVHYPLREWGMDRKACGQTIVDAGLPLPPKSSCFICSAMTRPEIIQLAAEDPWQHALALEVERLYRAGRHFRGDNTFIARGKHRLTGEKEEVTLEAFDVADARAQFRHMFDDEARPFKYDVSVSQAVVGLGRHFTWAGVQPKTGFVAPEPQVAAEIPDYFGEWT